MYGTFFYKLFTLSIFTQMRNSFRIALLAIVAAIASTAVAQERLALYFDWHNISFNQPDTVVYDVGISVGSPYVIALKPYNNKDKKLKKILKEKTLAVSVNDSVWFVNTDYLRKHYVGPDVSYLYGYTPLYFNDKIAYTQYSDENDSQFLHQLANYLQNGMSTVEILRLMTSYGFNFQNAFLFIIDPKTHVVETLNSDNMSLRLTPYLDMRRRYESMYFYQEPFVINHFFLEYTDRILLDDSIPYLID